MTREAPEIIEQKKQEARRLLGISGRLFFEILGGEVAILRRTARPHRGG